MGGGGEGWKPSLGVTISSSGLKCLEVVDGKEEELFKSRTTTKTNKREGRRWGRGKLLEEKGEYHCQGMTHWVPPEDWQFNYPAGLLRDSESVSCKQNQFKT